MAAERDDAQLSPLKRALFALRDLQGKLDALERARVEPIAIVGMACRFPGAPDLDSYWRLLEQGIDAIREVPKDRWDIDTYYDADPDAPGKTYSREGGFLDVPVDGFDAAFFGISPREVVTMDPQQRLLLEVTWEALENAGIPASSVAGASGGVFVGIGTNDYTQLTIQNDDPTRIDAYMGTGGASCVAAGRIAYILGMHGPAMAIDTACSSSLVAIDLAVQQLRAGRCRFALVGGVNVMLSPTATVYLSKVKALSPSSRCKTFDASADGYVRGEGCGMLVLKRLSDAQRDGDRVLAVIRGSAANHDGRSSGLTVPNGQAQQAVIRQALQDAGLPAADVAYVEAHGTGTPLGDPIELRALGAVLGPDRPADRPLLVGTVKTNIGHLEAAAGVAGVIKVVLAMQHGTIPPSLHFRTPTPHVAWDELKVAVPTRPTPWPAGHVPTAGVSAYGFSGTNAHVVVQAAPSVDGLDRAEATADRPEHLMAISAGSAAALADLAKRYASFIAREPGIPAADLAFSANSGRSMLAHRAAVVGGREQFMAALEALASGGSHPDLVTAAPGAEAPRLAFLFTGQGSQYAGMARELYTCEPIFRRALDECDALLRESLDRPLVEVMHNDDTGMLDQTGYTQPALFSIEYALAMLWRAWGIEPAFVMGHSVGEYVAACVAGLFGLEDGLRLIATRARLMQSLPAGGRMSAVFAPESVVAPLLQPYADRASIAAVNGPDHTVISGEADAVAAVVTALASRGVRSRDLVVSHAFHSPMMDPILDEFEKAAASVRFGTPRIRIVSNVTGRVGDAAELSQASYWRRHLREPVRFADSILTLHEQGCSAFLEIGPDATLLGMAGRCLPDGAGVWLPSLRRRGGDVQQMLRSAGALFVRGAALDLQAMDRGRTRQRVLLPNYPFQRDRYWIQTGAGRKAGADAAGEDGGHPLLTRRLRSAVLREEVFETTIDANTPGFMADHVVFGSPVFPATGYVELALAAARGALGAEPVGIDDLSIEEPLALTEGEARVLQVTMSAPDREGARFDVFSRRANDSADVAWTRHAAGTVVLAGLDASARPAGPDLESLRARCRDEIAVAGLYERFREKGREYGTRFRGMKQLWHGTNEALAMLEMPPELAGELDGYQAHPAFLDCSLQVLGAAFAPEASERDADDLYLPVGIERIRVAGTPPAAVWSHASIRDGANKEMLVADLRWIDEHGTAIVEITGLLMKRASSEMMRRASDRQLVDWLYDVEWQPANPAVAGSTTGAWLLCGGDESTVSAVRARLSEHGVAGTVAPASPLTRESVADVLAQAEAGGTIAGVAFLDSVGAGAPGSVDETEALESRLCGNLLSVVQALADRSGGTIPRLAIVTRGAYAVGAAPFLPRPEQAALWGMGRVIALEQPQLRCRMIDLDPAAPASDASLLAAELLSNADESEIAFRGGSRFVARLVRRGRATQGDRRLAVPAGESFRLATTARGVLDNLCLEPCERRTPGPGEVEIRVRASGLNFRDVLNALGMYPGDPGPMGGECAGRVVAVGEGVDTLKAGDDVLCLAGGAFTRFVTTPAGAAVRLPADLSYEQGASIPVTFLTAWYGLHHLAGIKKGDRVLVHAAAGGVGLAAVQIALRAGAEVYGTAGSDEKREFVRALGARDVFSSRNADFVASLMEQTGGAGVNIVLNSLTGEFIPRSLEVLAAGGHFLEIGKAEIWSAEQVAAVNPRVTYRPFDLAEVMHHDIPLIGFMFREVMDAMADGSLKPLPIRTFELQDALSAFRFMAQAKHVGKIVLTQREVPEGDSDGSALFDAGACYLVTGGCGGLGLKVAEWLVSRGARHLVLMGRSGPREQAKTTIAALESAGARVTIARGDVSREADVRRTLDEIAAQEAPLRGVFHTAGVLDDGVIVEQSWDRFARVMAPKVRGAALLDKLTRDRRLDDFVLFSSTSAVMGAPGQANYAAANAYMDALAQSRHAEGLPALSINWGAWGEVGMAARLGAREQGRMAERGIGAISPEHGTRVLEQLLRRSSSNVVVMPVRWPALLQSYPPGGEPPILRVIAREAGGRRTVGKQTGASDLLARLERAAPEARLEVMSSFVKTELARVLGIQNDAQLDVRAAFTALGVDSLMIVELRNALSAALKRPVQASLVFEHPTIESLAIRLLSDNGGTSVNAAVERGATDAPGAEAAKLLSSLDQLSDEKVDALLSQMMSEKDLR